MAYITQPKSKQKAEKASGHSASTGLVSANPFQLLQNGRARQPSAILNPFQLLSEPANNVASKTNHLIKSNNTGLPDNLKSGAENLSGYSLDDVKVHYNSDKPAQLRALAYAQGSDIHIAPGQEKHLPHETWHVVQQKQGRVAPTLQLKEGVAVNNDKQLESEADVMGTASLKSDSRDSALSSIKQNASGNKTQPLQLYTEFNHPTEGPMQVSESHQFFKPVNADRTLWAKESEIIKANNIMASNRDGIVTVAAAEEKEFLNQTYHRVAVVDRPARPGSLSSEKKTKESEAELVAESKDPFIEIINWLARQDGVTNDMLMSRFLAFRNPFSYGTYASGAFMAIYIQLNLEMDKYHLINKTAAAPVGKLINFLLNWQRQILMVNSEEAHRFNFMCTECGGFSRMIMPGGEKDQQDAEVGDRMKVNKLGDMPGPWQNHYAAVIMADGADRITLESAAGMDKWWFGIYGNKKLNQTFVVKTLLSKFQIGEDKGEAGSRESGDYLKAKLAGDNVTAALLGPTIGDDKTRIDTFLADEQDKIDAKKE